jgi:MFS family permease
VHSVSHIVYTVYGATVYSVSHIAYSVFLSGLGVANYYFACCIAHSLLLACSQLIAGWLSDRVSRPLILAVIYGVRALAYLLLLYVESMAALMCFSVIFGLVDYSVVPPTISLIGTHLGNDVLGLGVGMVRDRSHSDLECSHA